MGGGRSPKLPLKTQMQIQESDFYLAVVGDDLYRHPQTVLELQLAIRLNKPILVALKVGQQIPMELFQDANIIEVLTWEGNKESIKQCGEALVEAFEQYAKQEEGR